MSKQKGFTLFYAIIVVGILTIISFAVSRIALKEVVFSGLARSSQEAFYAANSGIECALYWDIKHTQFYRPFYPSIEAKEVECNNQVFADAGYGAPVGGEYTYTFTLNLGDGTKVTVDIKKTQDGNSLDTEIKSRGRSRNGNVERAIRVNY